MSSEISSSLVRSLNPSAELACTKKTEIKDVIKPLIIPIIKHVLVSKLNRLTGEKFESVRNWEAKSTKEISEKANSALAPLFNEKLEEIGNTVRDGLEKIKTSDKDVGKVLNLLGVNVCEQFISAAIALLTHVGEDGKPQTLNRLLSITGIACSRNDKLKETFIALTRMFFNKCLPKILKEKLGILAGPVEKLIIALSIKETVEKFFTERILKNPDFSPNDISPNSTSPNSIQPNNIQLSEDLYVDVFCQFFMILTKRQGWENVKIEDLIKDERLDSKVRSQLENLKTAFDESKMAQNLFEEAGNLTSRILSSLPEKDRIANMEPKALCLVLVGIVASYGFEKMEPIKGAIGKGVKVAETVCSVVNTGKTIFNWGVEGCKTVGGAIVSLTGCVCSWFHGKEDVKQENEPKQENSVKSESNVKQEDDVKSKDDVDQKGKLEEEISEYLKNLFDEEKAIEERERVVKEQTGSGTGIMAAIGNGIWAAGKMVGDTVAWVCGFGSNTPASEDGVNPEAKSVSPTPEGETGTAVSNAPSSVDSNVETQTLGLATQGKAHEPVASSELDTQKKAESSDSSEQKVEESGTDKAVEGQERVVEEQTSSGTGIMAAIGNGILAAGKMVGDTVAWFWGSGSSTSGSEEEAKSDSATSEGKTGTAVSNAPSGVDSGVETQTPGLATQGEAHEPVASSKPDTQKKVESSDSSEQKVEESGKKDVDSQTTTAETKTQEVKVAESVADVQKAKETQNGNFSWWNPFSWWS